MKNLKRVVWSKGMFLSPQHFQVQDDYLEDSLQFRLSASSRNGWGLTDLSVDQESLSNGQFVIRNCRGVFRDGLPFHIPDTDDPPPSRDVATCFPPAQRDLDVFLTLPERRPRGRSVTLGAVEGRTRYVAETVSAVDQVSGIEEKPVQVCGRNFRIVLGGEPLDGTSSIRIARIIRGATGEYLLQQDFIPPALSLEASEHLLILLRRLIEALAGKAASLSAQRRQKGRSQADFASTDAGLFWLLHTINTYLPLLKHLWTQRRAHPERMYVTMLGLAGALTTFALGDGARDLPDYGHDDPGACFGALEAHIRDLLETAIPSKCVVVPWLLREKSMWTGSLADARMFERTQFLLAVRAEIGIEEVIKQVPKLVKVAAASELDRLVRNALPGISLRHMPVPPAGVPVKLDRQYFALNQSGILWDGLVKTRQAAVFVPDEIASAELELLVVTE